MSLVCNADNCGRSGICHFRQQHSKCFAAYPTLRNMNLLPTIHSIRSRSNRTSPKHESMARSAKKTVTDGDIVSIFRDLEIGRRTEPATTFNKEQWVESLTPEQRSLLRLEIETMHESWLAYLNSHLESEEFLQLKRSLAQETLSGKTWFPSEEDLYSWFVFLLLQLTLESIY